MAAQESSRPIHSLVLDTGPLILNDPPASALMAQAERLYAPQSVLDEIRDKAARSRVETTLLPFITIRSPGKESMRFVHDFARRTGDLHVLSRTDVEVLALAYELECERNGGDWRLRKTPGQERINGPPPGQADACKRPEHEPGADAGLAAAQATQDVETRAQHGVSELQDGMLNLDLDQESHTAAPGAASAEDGGEADSTAGAPADKTTEAAPESPAASAHPADGPDKETFDHDGATSDSDSDGWITPSNLKKQQAKDSAPSTGAGSARHAAQTSLQAAVLTSDYAMQNVALRINLNLVAPSLKRITHLRTWVLRCHGCFAISRDLTKQFCPSCGQPTLLRTSCSTDAQGRVSVHLKKHFEYNKRGNVYSVPKPVCGSANGRLPRGGGGKNAWGQGLILAEDQKEYTRAEEERRRVRARDIMDRDYLPGLMGGDRLGHGERIRVGAGRNVNSRRKR
ncbi:hypothetical protein CDD81_3216 [Ophiocordyceps australis]|uniref:20S-pre-rRNA D-site endonuclease NOB1 n=1 Tax=Ophiocordyceps australis TaxID=1399860 RepID=A0A2C5XVD6_9HYPO|nr:hypothetical protein CDD81_3216 [Ophiocordyceps australis]